MHFEWANFYLNCLEEFLLEDVKNYTFLTHGAVPVPGVDEAAEFKSTVQAMHIMGLNAEELSGTCFDVFLRRTRH